MAGEHDMFAKGAEEPVKWPHGVRVVNVGFGKTINGIGDLVAMQKFTVFDKRGVRTLTGTDPGFADHVDFHIAKNGYEDKPC